MEDKAYWKCDYTYEEKGEVKTTEYKSPNQYDNSTNPNMIAKMLAREIKSETGRTVKSFIRLVEMPVVSKGIQQVGDLKVKNGISLGEIVYNVAATEEEIKEVEENRKKAENLIVDIVYNYIKKNN
ncbi:hypothetical protein [Lysinibacillus xylanilyticus]|uniref:Uncharacterized protein n=1 Tax=Lysinibacillus xylanilyticus TaxID=582475 RepID=A0ABT4F0N5_9BACI|nr:hypothetical protein [Lysinibacillus xylanilyticus]MCY9550024.1 hypothetical protein [Lysinibacillus xylanilyticus]